MRRKHLREIRRIDKLVYPRPWSMALYLDELQRAGVQATRHTRPPARCNSSRYRPIDQRLGSTSLSIPRISPSCLPPLVPMPGGWSSGARHPAGTRPFRDA